MTADDTTHPPAPMPTERGTAVENESEPCLCAGDWREHPWNLDTCPTPAAPVETQVEAMLRIQRDYEAAEAAEPDAGDVEALSDLLYRARQSRVVPDTVPEWLDARAILASDWLAAHDAEVYARALRDGNKVAEAAIAEVARDTAEQIAQAIEDTGERIAQSIEAIPHVTKFGYVPGEHIKADAARIAREAR